MHLLLPCASFLFSLLPLLQGQYWRLWKMAYGGRALTGRWGTVWFVPILFLTQQVMKQGNYGWPLLSLAFSLAAVHLVCQLCRVRSLTRSQD